MKKTIKRILHILGALIVLIILIVAGFAIKIKTELNKMSPLETGEIIDNIYSIKDEMVNMFLIEDSGKYIAFDCGYHPDTITDELDKLKIDPDLIVAVFLTHTDYDHSGAISLFPNAAVYFSEEDEKLLTGEEPRMLFTGNSIDTDDYILLEDRQIINIGNLEIMGILTTGHTPGSTCYLVNGKYLFTGDAIGLSDGEVVRFNKIFNSWFFRQCVCTHKNKNIAGSLLQKEIYRRCFSIPLLLDNKFYSTIFSRTLLHYFIRFIS